jgi:hypothetical protein
VIELAKLIDLIVGFASPIAQDKLQRNELVIKLLKKLNDVLVERHGKRLRRKKITTSAVIRLMNCSIRMQTLAATWTG